MDVNYIPAPPRLSGDQLIPELQDITHELNAAGEPSMSSLGLGGYWPKGWVEHAVEFFYADLGLPWWASIALCKCLVHGSLLKQKKFTDTKSLGITRPYLVRQPVNTPLICQIRGDITMSFRCDHALKQLVHGFSSFHFDMAPRLRLGTISRGTWKP